MRYKPLCSAKGKKATENKDTDSVLDTKSLPENTKAFINTLSLAEPMPENMSQSIEQFVNTAAKISFEFNAEAKNLQRFIDGLEIIDQL